MAIILTIANQKGGVGKTTTSVNLAAGLARHGKRVLLVDLDPQGNATMGSGIDKRRLERSLYHVLIGHTDVRSAAIESEVGGYSVLPANRDLAGAEIEMVDLEAREGRLRMALQQVQDDFDFVLIDAPPSLSILTLNGLCAANGVIIPMQCEYFALEGLSDLVNTIRKVHANFNTSIRIIGILRVMFDRRMTLSQQVSAQLEAHFKDKVFTAVVPRNVRLAEAPSHGMPGVVFDESSRGAQAYLQFAAELIEKIPMFAPPGAQPSQSAPTAQPAPASEPAPTAALTPAAAPPEVAAPETATPANSSAPADRDTEAAATTQATNPATNPATNLAATAAAPEPVGSSSEATPEAEADLQAPAPGSHEAQQASAYPANADIDPTGLAAETTQPSVATPTSQPVDPPEPGAVAIGNSDPANSDTVQAATPATGTAETEKQRRWEANLAEVDKALAQAEQTGPDETASLSVNEGRADDARTDEAATDASATLEVSAHSTIEREQPTQSEPPAADTATEPADQKGEGGGEALQPASTTAHEAESQPQASTHFTPTDEIAENKETAPSSEFSITSAQGLGDGAVIPDYAVPPSPETSAVPLPLGPTRQPRPSFASFDPYRPNHDSALSESEAEAKSAGPHFPADALSYTALISQRRQAVSRPDYRPGGLTAQVAARESQATLVRESGRFSLESASTHSQVVRDHEPLDAASLEAGDKARYRPDEYASGQASDNNSDASLAGASPSTGDELQRDATRNARRDAFPDNE